jgi:thioredoxin-dependent peroxiredoxin
MKKSKPTIKSKPTASTPKQRKIGIEVGALIPEVNLESTTGMNFQRSNLLGKKTVIFFYPKDSTPGCTIESKEFSQLKDEFESHQTQIYGVSRDSIDSHKKFMENENLCIDLLSDPDEVLCDIFGVIQEKSLYGRKFMGVVRSTFLVDENGRLLKKWDKVSAPGHAQEVLNFIKSLEASPLN